MFSELSLYTFFQLFDIIAPNARQQAIFDADMPGWVAIGFSPDGGMFSSDAVVGIPSQGTATEYDLDSKVRSRDGSELAQVHF